MFKRLGVFLAVLVGVEASTGDLAFVDRLHLRRGFSLRHAFRLRSRVVAQSTSTGRTENVVIVGSGPAGYTAAIYCARANLKPLVFEGAISAGGQLMATSEVENFPGFPEGILGPDLMANMRKQAVRWGSEIESEDIMSVDLKRRPFLLKTSSDQVVEANSLILATGAAAKRLFLPNEDKYWSRGITACAICDGAAPMYRDEPLAVVGGGDSAVEEAVYLTKYSPEVHLLVRGSELRASKAMQDRVKANAKVTIHYNTEAQDVYGDDPEHPFQKSPLRGIHILNKKTGKVDKLPVRGLFYAIGHEPNTGIFHELALDDKGYIKVNPGTADTSVPGVFAAGDVQDPHWRQAVTAAGSGCMAALSAERYLAHEGLLREFHQAEPTATASTPVAAVSTASSSASSAGTATATAASSTGLAPLHFKGEEAFKNLQSTSKLPTLVMFMSKTCGPCRILKPILTRVLKEYDGRVNFVEVDIEDSPDLTLQSGIAGTPTVQVFLGENLRTTLRGVKKSAEYKQEIEGALADAQ